jgi:hypothetical protein
MDLQHVYSLLVFLYQTKMENLMASDVSSDLNYLDVGNE